MGADFVCVLVPEPTFDNLRIVSNIADIRDEIFERIINDEYVQQKIAEDIFQRGLEEMNEDAWLEALDIVSDYVNVAVHPPRDCGNVVLECRSGHPTKVYVVTGGMSWGDSPTDSFDALAFLEDTGLLDMPFRAPQQVA